MKPYTFCKKSLPIVLAIFSTVAFTSCQKDFPQKFKDHGHEFRSPLVFVAGYESNGVNRVAKCWIDDQDIILSDGTNDAYANSIFVAGNEIYVAGNDGGPVYWKNTREIHLPVHSNSSTSFNSANSIAVSGGHVYVAGTDGGKAVYWKDGTENMLNTTNVYGDFEFSEANSVFIKGNDVYAAGIHGPNAVYWRNGAEIYLSHLDLVGSNYTNESAQSIYVSGANVFVVGSVAYVGALYTLGRYWKNGMDEFASLDHSNFEDIIDANAVFVSGNNVYIAGIGINPYLTPRLGAAYWTNGNESILAASGISSGTSDIYVKGNDVYVSGYDESYENNDYQSYAVYWRNGTEVKLTDGTRSAAAASIFIR
jgi:hypothetical protein